MDNIQRFANAFGKKIVVGGTLLVLAAVTSLIVVHLWTSHYGFAHADLVFGGRRTDQIQTIEVRNYERRVITRVEDQDLLGELSRSIAAGVEEFRLSGERWEDRDTTYHGTLIFASGHRVGATIDVFHRHGGIAVSLMGECLLGGERYPQWVTLDDAVASELKRQLARRE